MAFEVPEAVATHIDGLTAKVAGIAKIEADKAGRIAAIAGIAYLKSKNLKWDTLAVSATEVGLAFGAANLISGMIWARIIWGIWWTWDARLTLTLFLWFLYLGYLVLRGVIPEREQRARYSAIVNLARNEDGVVRDVPLRVAAGDWALPSLPLQQKAKTSKRERSCSSKISGVKKPTACMRRSPDR